jgi:anti-sigma factor RsiW
VSEQGRLQRIERLLEERNALAREALAMQRSALEETREIVALQRANIERANEVNRQAASTQRGARLFMLALLPVILVLIGYVSWLIFTRLRV